MWRQNSPPGRGVSAGLGAVGVVVAAPAVPGVAPAGLAPPCPLRRCRWTGGVGSEERIRGSTFSRPSGHLTPRAWGFQHGVFEGFTGAVHWACPLGSPNSPVPALTQSRVPAALASPHPHRGLFLPSTRHVRRWGKRRPVPSIPSLVSSPAAIAPG